jgi:hypothetical protein
MKTLTLSPVDGGRREPDPASALTYQFVPYHVAPKPHPDLKASDLFLNLLYSGMVVGFFVGLGWGAYWLLQKVWDWL